MNFKNTIFFCGMTVLLSFLILNGSMTYQSSFAATTTTTEYEHKLKWGEKGVATGQFNQVTGITVTLKIIFMSLIFWSFKYDSKIYK